MIIIWLLLVKRRGNFRLPPATLSLVLVLMKHQPTILISEIVMLLFVPLSVEEPGKMREYYRDRVRIRPKITLESLHL